ncbi:MAG: zinc ribbon domain-containing protein [Polyangiaceae bacterium]
MPLYEYECREHGVFELVRPMADSAKGAECPWCQSKAPRILSAPAVQQVAFATRVALDRNEKSRHEPVLQRRTRPADTGAPIRPVVSHGRPWALEHG